MQVLFTLILTLFLAPKGIDLNHFSAVAVDNSIKLQWTIVRSADAAYFKIERSSDDKNYESITRIAADDNYEFSYIDEKPLNGESYYRLRMFAKDGSNSFSEPIRIETGKGKTVFVPTGAKWRSDDYFYK